MRIPVWIGNTGAVLLVVIAVVGSVIAVAELAGYYWLVMMNTTLYLSFDKRPLQALVFGAMAGSALSLLVIAVFSRRGQLPRQWEKTFAGILAIIIVWSWSFLSLSFAENVIYPVWIFADILVLIATFGALTWRRTRLTRRSALIALAFAMALSLSLALPGYASTQRTTLWAFPLTCAVNRCPFGLADPTSPGPPWGRLLQGRIYDFYFDVVNGRAGVMLNSQPGTGNTTYWNVGGGQGSSNWNGVGVYEFEWSPTTSGFYQLVLVNQDAPSSSFVIIRVTSL